MMCAVCGEVLIYITQVWHWKGATKVYTATEPRWTHKAGFGDKPPHKPEILT